MGVHCPVVVCKDLFLIYLQQVESNVIGVGFNGVGEELNLEAYLRLSHELECQSEPSLHN